MSLNNNQSRIVFRVRKNSDFGGGVDTETPFQKQDLKFYQRKAKNLMGETKMGAETVSNESELHNGITCFECGKNFRSLRSLYGHLRCHPNREEKMKFEDQNKNSPYTSGRLLGFDWLSTLSGWAITGRRGRKGFPSAREREAIDGLLKLINWDASDLEKRTTNEAVNAEISRKRPKFDNDNGVFGIGCNPGIQVEEVQLGSTTFSGCMIPVYVSSSTGSLMKISQFGLMNCNNQTTMCSTNTGTLHCYQALECHESSLKAEVEELSIAERNVAQVDNDLQKFNASTIMQSNVKTHQCNIRNKSFATGSALGGHKRLHWTARRKRPITPFLEEALTVG